MRGFAQRGFESRSGLLGSFPSGEAVAPDVVMLRTDRVPMGTWRVDIDGGTPDVSFDAYNRGDRESYVLWKVDQYTRFGFRDYHVYEAGCLRPSGCRLVAGRRIYESLSLYERGRYRSELSGLWLAAGEGVVHFYDDDGLILAGRFVAKEAKRRSREEARRADEELAMRAVAELRVDEEESRRGSASGR